MRIVAAAALAALTIAVPAAQAAEPATGEVSATHLSQSWSGEAYGYPGKLLSIAGMQNHETCSMTLCDSFTLEVKDAGHLKLYLIAPGSAEYVDVLITKPDGSTEFLQSEEAGDSDEVVYENAAKGTYTVDIWPNEFPGGYNGQYSGTAELCLDAFDQCFLPPPDEEEEEY